MKDLPIPANKTILQEAQELSASILSDIELSRSTLSATVLRATRLARILNDEDHQQIFQWESAGYPTTPKGVSPEVWRLAQLADRVFEETDESDDSTSQYMYANSIEVLEHIVDSGPTNVTAADTFAERRTARESVSKAIPRLAARRAFIYQYASQKYYELKFANLADDVFGRMRAAVDSSIGHTVPEAVRKLTAVHENLRSNNSEDWSNAAHSCRRVLQDLADALFLRLKTQEFDKLMGRNSKSNLGRTTTSTG